jgi:hypothetical protein
MDRLRSAAESLPPKLWRVQYRDCQTNDFPWDGLTAQDTTTFYSEDELESFRKSVERQFTWGWRDPQPYISLFSDKDHAENWAFKEPWNNGRRTPLDWEVITIDTKELEGVYVFNLSHLLSQMKLSLPEKAQQHSEGAYLCLHRIPASALLDRRSSWEVEEGI